MHGMDGEPLKERARRRHAGKVHERLPLSVRQYCQEAHVEEELSGARFRIYTTWTTANGRLMANAETYAYLVTGAIAETVISYCTE
jgi:hypothetical protein